MLAATVDEVVETLQIDLDETIHLVGEPHSIDVEWYRVEKQVLEETPALSNRSIRAAGSEVDEIIRPGHQSHLFSQLPASCVDDGFAGADVTARKGVYLLRELVARPSTFLQQHTPLSSRLPSGPDEDGAMPVVITMYLSPCLLADDVQVFALKNVERFVVVSQGRR